MKNDINQPLFTVATLKADDGIHQCAYAAELGRRPAELKRSAANGSHVTALLRYEPREQDALFDGHALLTPTCAAHWFDGRFSFYPSAILEWLDLLPSSRQALARNNSGHLPACLAFLENKTIEIAQSAETRFWGCPVTFAGSWQPVESTCNGALALSLEDALRAERTRPACKTLAHPYALMRRSPSASKAFTVVMHDRKTKRAALAATFTKAALEETGRAGVYTVFARAPESAPPSERTLLALFQKAEESALQLGWREPTFLLLNPAETERLKVLRKLGARPLPAEHPSAKLAYKQRVSTQALAQLLPFRL